MFVPVFQNVVHSKFIKGLTSAVQDLDSQCIVNTGATARRDIVLVTDLPTVLVKYNEAIGWMFIVGAVMGWFSALRSSYLRAEDRERRQVV